jgi:hypothetical protein
VLEKSDFPIHSIAWYPIQPNHTFTATRVSCFRRKELVGSFWSSSSVMPKVKAGVLVWITFHTWMPLHFHTSTRFVESVAVLHPGGIVVILAYYSFLLAN